MATSLSPPPPETSGPVWTRWLQQFWDTVRGVSDLSSALGTVANTLGTQEFRGKTIDGAHNTLTDVSPGSLLVPRFMAKMSTGTNVPNNTGTAIPYATGVFDSHNAFGGTLFTIPEDGDYFFSAQLMFEAASYTALQLAIERTGLGAVAVGRGDGLSGFHTVHAAGFCRATAGQTIFVSGYQTNGAAATRSTWADANYSNFMGWRVA